MTTTTAVDQIPALDHNQAMILAAAEYQQVFAVLNGLTERDWTRPTDCPDWNVRALAGHMLGMFELLADPAEAQRQAALTADAAANSGANALDELTALQVREHAHLTVAELGPALRDAARAALAARQGTTAQQRAAPYPTLIPGESGWTVGYLLDIIHTRDPWMHRIDIHRATGTDLTLSADHDGRIVSNVVADWAQRHQQSFELNLTGPAGGSYRCGESGPALSLDAIEFCRILSGRAPGGGLLATTVPF